MYVCLYVCIYICMYVCMYCASFRRREDITYRTLVLEALATIKGLWFYATPPYFPFSKLYYILRKQFEELSRNKFVFWRFYIIAGIEDGSDNCPKASNPDQLDLDGDGIGDVCDNCQFTSSADEDDDNFNGYGNVCEPGSEQDEYVHS